MTIYDGSARELACDLFDRAFGYRVVVGRLGVPAEAVRVWRLTYRAVGRGVLLDMGVHRTCDCETKVAEARAVVDDGMGRL